MSTLNTAALVSSTARPTSYGDHDVVSYWAQHIRDENGAEAGDSLRDFFGACMRAYGADLQRIPAYRVTGFELTASDIPKVYRDGSRRMTVTIRENLSGVIDYTNGLPIRNQSFIHVFVSKKNWAYAEQLIDSEIGKDMLLYVNTVTDVVRFELIDPNSPAAAALLSESDLTLKNVPVVLPVEGKKSNIDYETASVARQVIDREANGTSLYSKVSQNPLMKRVMGALGS